MLEDPRHNRVIHKHPLTYGRNFLRLPRSTSILSAGLEPPSPLPEPSRLVLWESHPARDPLPSTFHRVIQVVFTGEDFWAPPTAVHLATLRDPQGYLVYHVFDFGWAENLGMPIPDQPTPGATP